MLGLSLREEFRGKRLKGTAIELSNDSNTGATQIAAQSFLEDKGCAISPINTDPAEWGGSMIKMRVKPRPSGRGRKARSDIENVAATDDLFHK